MGGKRGSEHIKSVYLTLCSRRTVNLVNSQQIKVKNIATVDAPGCVYIHFPLIDLHYRRPVAERNYYIHIGVGSDVVCSTFIGNTRASVRGTDNSDGSTLFYVLKST